MISYTLFTHPITDQSDSDLRHALANMVAVVIGSPKASNHLWYHIFAPGDLADTYMTGFMVTFVAIWYCLLVYAPPYAV